MLIKFPISIDFMEAFSVKNNCYIKIACFNDWPTY